MAKAAKPAPSAKCETCGQHPVLRYKNYQFFWMQGIDMEISELPEGSILSIHPTFIVVDAKDGWQIVIPMDNIRFINVSDPI